MPPYSELSTEECYEKLLGNASFVYHDELCLEFIEMYFKSGINEIIPGALHCFSDSNDDSVITFKCEGKLEVFFKFPKKGDDGFNDTRNSPDKFYLKVGSEIVMRSFREYSCVFRAVCAQIKGFASIHQFIPSFEEYYPESDITLPSQGTAQIKTKYLLNLHNDFFLNIFSESNEIHTHISSELFIISPTTELSSFVIKYSLLSDKNLDKPSCYLISEYDNKMFLKNYFFDIMNQVDSARKFICPDNHDLLDENW